MEYLWIYLFQLVQFFDTIRPILCILTTTFILSYVFLSIQNKVVNCDDKDTQDLINFLRISKPLLIICIFLSLVCIFIPTKETMLLFGGTYLSKYVIKSTIIDDKIKKIDQVIDLQLDSYIKELQLNK